MIWPRRMIVGKLDKFSYKLYTSTRYVCTTKDAKMSSPSVELSESARPFSEIPGPRGLPIIGNILRYIPGIGEYGGLHVFDLMKQLRADYGDIVRFEGLPSCRPSVLLFDTKLIELMYRKEGRWPSRMLAESVHRYTHSHMEKDQLPLFTRQGKHWYECRSLVNQYIMKPSAINPYLPQINEVSDDFVNEMHRIRDPISHKLPKDFTIYLCKLMLECNFNVILNQRVGFFGSNSTPNKDAVRLFDANTDFLKCIYDLDLRPSLAKYYETPKLKLFNKKLDTIVEVTTNQIQKGIERIKNRPESSNERACLLERALPDGEMTALMTLRDVLIDGIDSTANAIGKALYLIATHPEVQEKLKAELDVALPRVDTPFTEHTAKQIPYLKACIKETLRVYPIGFGALRTLNEDTVIAGYNVPKGMDLIAVHGILSGDEKHFSDPKKFIPERWLRDSSATTVCPAENANKFSYMPFGFGPRVCSGRRLANTYMEVFLSRIVKRFDLEWHNEPLQETKHLVNLISSPLQLTVLDR